MVIAPTCAACGDPLEIPLAGAVCARCWSQINRLADPLCHVCGDALSTWQIDGRDRLCTRCARHPRLITIGRAVGPYEGTLRDVLHVLKYDKRRSVARPLGRLMSEAGTAVLAGADFLVPVPLHFVRHYRRGFNQARELARHVGVPVVNALRRRRATATQTDLPEAERHQNVRDAFSVRRGSRKTVENAVLIVVDDVSTTGATLDACAAVLLSAGAKDVRALTAARAVSRLL